MNAGQHVYLEIIHGVNTGRRHAVQEGAVSLGRSSKNTLPFPAGDKPVSSHHAILYRSPERLLIQDLQSTNGTFVNDIKINEQELKDGDIISLGRSGPRLRVILSDTEIADQGGRVPDSQPSTIPTGEEDVRPVRTRSTTSLTDEYMAGSDVGSRTMEYEQQLRDKNMSATDMHSLFRDGGRVERIVQRGNISDTSSHMLHAAYRADKKQRTHARTILIAIISMSVVIIGILAFRMFQYRAMVTKSTTLESQLDTYENRIAELNSDPRANREELLRMIRRLDETHTALSSVKSQLKYTDRRKLYADTIEQYIDEVMQRFGETDYHIPPQMTERIKHYLKSYSGPMRKTIIGYLSRRPLYFPTIVKVFREKNIPVELAYVSVLESGLNPVARSHAGAVGLWQFMPRTARGYGMKVSGKLDERKEPVKATYAAAEYFRDLIAIFGGKRSVMLAMAAYNAGEYRVMGALRKVENPITDRDFWYLYRMGYLPEETMEYIPRIIAIMILSEYPGNFGFTNVPSSRPTAPSSRDGLELTPPKPAEPEKVSR